MRDSGERTADTLLPTMATQTIRGPCAVILHGVEDAGSIGRGVQYFSMRFKVGETLGG
jgi:hypothetical protein